MRTIKIVTRNRKQPTTIEDLVQKVWGLSKKQIHLLRMNKEMTVNQLPVGFNDWVKNGEELILPVLEKSKFYEPYPFDVEVLFEDEHVIVLNKPVHMKVHPNHPDQMDTLCNALAFYLQKEDKEIDVRYIHRLDENTSGAILFAKHAYAQTILDRSMQTKEINRVYVACCEGKFFKKSGIIEEKIGEDRNHPSRRRVSNRGEYALTHFTVSEQLNSFAIVEFKLSTGRTHQIRVHIAYVGHPIVGDLLYGAQNKWVGHQALHARTLEFPHPFTGEKITVHAPLPTQLQKLMDDERK